MIPSYRERAFEMVTVCADAIVTKETMLIATGGEVVYRQHSAIDPAALKKIIADRLGRTYAQKKKNRNDFSAAEIF